MNNDTKSVGENMNKQNNSNANNGLAMYQYIFKIILIGDCNIGKTSIINRYIHNTFESVYLCTIGVDFMMKTIDIDDRQIKLQIWDTAGMERYKQVTTSYYRGAQAAIVVFDLTNKTSFENVPKWISGFFEYSNPLFQKHLLLVGNKSDLVEERKVTQEEIETYIKINSFEYIECSAKDGKNIENIFINLGHKLYDNYKYANVVKSSPVETKKITILNSNIAFQDLLKKEEKNKCCK